MNKDSIISITSGARDELIRTAQAVPDDKLNWKPLDNGRTVLDLLGDAAQTPLLVIELLQSGGEIKLSPEIFAQMRQERANWTREEAVEHLQRSSEAMFAALQNMSDEELARPITLPFGGGMTLPLGGWAMMAHRSFTSRFAQINYIQTLYGDFDRH